MTLIHHVITDHYQQGIWQDDTQYSEILWWTRQHIVDIVIGKKVIAGFYQKEPYLEVHRLLSHAVMDTSTMQSIELDPETRWEWDDLVDHLLVWLVRMRL